jgi:hypothetical protein
VAFVIGGSPCSSFQQPVVALLHALGSTPITAVHTSSNPALGHSGVPVVELLGGI